MQSPHEQHLDQNHWYGPTDPSHDAAYAKAMELNIDAILGSDHMIRTPEGHDPDRWFRVTILQMAGHIRELEAENKDAWEQFDELRHGAWRPREQ